MLFQHQPVLLQEVVDHLNLSPGKIVMDCTLGGGGHSQAILKRILPGGRLIGLDQDGEALVAAQQTLSPFGAENYHLIRANFKRLKAVWQNMPYGPVDGVLFDLGVSSHQLTRGERGFSYQQDVPLDMRMDQTGPFTASDLVNGYTAEELTQIIRDYGEEKWARRIALFIVQERKKEPIRTTGRLVEIIKMAIPHGARRTGPHPAKRTFQAIRIVVNQELAILPAALQQGWEILKPGGRMLVITFHSLEDRLVKRVFKSAAQGCNCPRDLPVCVCGREAVIKIVTTKPVVPSPAEITGNPRARSAKLRVVEKVAPVLKERKGE